MAEEVAALSVRLEATVQRFEQQIQRARRTLDRQSQRMERRVDSLDRRFARFGARFGKQLMAGLGAFAGAQGLRRLAGSFQETLNRLDDIAKQADKLGVTVEALQEMRFAAEQSGVAVNTFDMAFQRFTRRAAEAANGTGEAEAALAELNIQLRDSEGRMRPMETLFEEVADALAGVESQSDRVRLAFKLFDSEGVAVLNMLQNGSEAMRRMRQEARDLGIVMKEDVVRDAVVMKDELSQVFQVIGRNWDRLMLRMARNFVQIFDLMPNDIDQQMIEAMGELGKINQQLETPSVMRGPGDTRSRAEREGDLKQRQQELQERVRVLRGLQKAEEAARRMSNEPIGTSGGGGGGAGGGGGSGSSSARQEEAATIRDVLELLEREIEALDLRAATMRMNEAEAAAFRAEQEALNKARELGIDLDAKAENSNRTNRELIQLWAGDVAAATQRVQELRDAKEENNQADREGARTTEEHRRVLGDFAGGLLSTLRSGETGWESYANVAVRALDRIVEKLLNDVLEALLKVNQASSGAGGGGFLGALIGLVGGIFSGGAGAGGVNTAVGAGGGSFFSGGGGRVPLGFHRGGAFVDGHEVTAFARGGVVDRPTTFPMANGIGLMGESGAEAVMPLRRGPGGRLGVEAAGGQQGPTNIYNIDARGADAGAVERIEQVLKQTVGPGKIERRAVAAVSDARLRGHDVLRGR